MALLLTIVFIFLFVSTIWGISAIVGGVKQAFAPRPKRQAAPPTSAQDISPEQTPKDQTTEAQSNNIDHILAQLELISRLRKERMLTDEEFAQIKQKLMHSMSDQTR